MSQNNADHYKKERERREKEARNEIIEQRVTLFFAALLGVLIIVWAGFGIYQKITSPNTSKDPVTTEVDLSPITDYMNEHSLNNAN